MLNLQFSGQFQGQNVTVKQVSRKGALAALITGKRVMICPAKIAPLSSWAMGCEMAPLLGSAETYKEEFDEMVNSFRWHNCTSETGMYCRFYLITEKEDYDAFRAVEDELLRPNGMK